MKSARSRSWSKHNLPEEVWREILSMLPVKSLVRFRCVSKSWQSIIDDPDFCRLHLGRFKNNLHQTHLFVVQGDYLGADCFVKCSSTFKTTARLGSLGRRKGHGNSLVKLPTFSYPGKWDVVSSIDGLVMLRNKLTVLSSPTPELLLWNPSLRKFRSVPSSPEISYGMTYIDLGLAYDHLINNYKHVRVAHLVESSLYRIAIFTLDSDSWKTIPCLSWRWSLRHGFSKTISFQGCLYFIAKKMDANTYELVSFDLSNEMFASTCLPVDANIEEFTLVDKELTVIDGACTLLQYANTASIGSLWVLESPKTDSKSMCWNKRYSFTPTYKWPWKFLYLKKNGDLLLKDCMKMPTKVASCNIETHKEKLLIKNVRPRKLLGVFDYKESLYI